jgi:class 3 adenylate cyclase
MCGFGYVYRKEEHYKIPDHLKHASSNELQQTEKPKEVTFEEESMSCCVGIVDIVNSTAITAKLVNGQLAKYYSTFLNTMSDVVRDFLAIVVKNIGDSLLYYFPETSYIDKKTAFSKVLECSLTMIEYHTVLNEVLYNEGLPEVNYRISADYGNILIGRPSNSPKEDIFGSTVNLCKKINSIAKPNGIVIGGDLYLNVKNLEGYDFNFITTCSSGFNLEYPVYSIIRSKAKEWF